MANLKIAILADNRALKNFTAEHGLSMYIETEAVRILFDTGQGHTFQHNARLLGIDLAKTDILLLSHGHYDHTGGISHVLQKAGSAHVYCHPGVVNPRYGIRDGKPKPIQMPSKSMIAIDTFPSGQIHWIQKPFFISDKIGLTGPIPRQTRYENPGGPFYLDPMGKRADPIEDDMALWVQTHKGLVIFVGCCHAGLVNTLNYIRQLNDNQRIRAIMGGFHLLNAGPKRLDQTITAMHVLNLDRVIPCHCTGEAAVSLLSDAFGTKITPGSAGMKVCFEN